MISIIVAPIKKITPPASNTNNITSKVRYSDVSVNDIVVDAGLTGCVEAVVVIRSTISSSSDSSGVTISTQSSITRSSVFSSPLFPSYSTFIVIG